MLLSLARSSLFHLSVFPFFPRNFKGSEARKFLAFFGGFSLVSARKKKSKKRKIRGGLRKCPGHLHEWHDQATYIPPAKWQPRIGDYAYNFHSPFGVQLACKSAAVRSLNSEECQKLSGVIGANRKFE